MEPTSMIKLFCLVLFMTSMTVFVFDKLALFPLDDGDLTEYLTQKIGERMKFVRIQTVQGENSVNVFGNIQNSTAEMLLTAAADARDWEISNKSSYSFVTSHKEKGSNNSRTEMPLTTEMESTGREKYLLDNKNCLIPDIDPLDNEDKSMRLVTCLGKPSITYVDGSFLRLNRTHIRHFYGGNFKYCQYMPIKRGDNQKRGDFSFKYENASEKFDQDIMVPPENEYMRVKCYNKLENLIFTNFHAFVIPKNTVEEKCNELFKKHLKESKPKETFNVILLGVDSVSRLNYAQCMPRTRDFLLNELKAFEMKGYNKVADNTFPNIVPLTTGKFIHEFGDKRFLNAYFDKHDFFWKNFSRAGYRTMYSEDAPTIAVFIYRKKGFQYPPADFYNRHLAVALEKETQIWNSDHHCIGNKMETQNMLDYLTDYSRTFKDKPHFAFTFITRLTHNLPAMLAAGDEPYLDFFKTFKREGRLNNTIIFFYGDHGIRFGKSRHSYRGKIEDRLPMMSVIVPPSFHHKYPHLVQNLKTNTRRLTSPLDIYETVKDIINFDGLDKKAHVSDRGISLFREVPIERTCDNAQINPHWCMCLGEERMNVTTPFAKAVGQGLIRILNKILYPVKHKCVQLRLGEITALVKKESSARVSNGTILQDRFELNVARPRTTNAPLLYQITLYTLPSNALFEATIFYDKEKSRYQFVGDISRLNRYGDQSICINDFRLKLFCYCG